MHELGHALAARLAGMRVFALLIGRGPLLAAGHVAGTQVAWRLFPTTGVTFAASRAPTRGRVLLYVCGGVLANAVVALVVLAASGGAGAKRPPSRLTSGPRPS